MGSQPNAAALQMGLQWGFSGDFAAELLRDDNLDDLAALHSDLLSSSPQAYVHPARGRLGAPGVGNPMLRGPLRPAAGASSGGGQVGLWIVSQAALAASAAVRWSPRRVVGAPIGRPLNFDWAASIGTLPAVSAVLSQPFDGSGGARLLRGRLRWPVSVARCLYPVPPRRSKFGGRPGVQAIVGFAPSDPGQSLPLQNAPLGSPSPACS